MLNSLERKFGWLSIQGLPLYIVSAQGMIYIWELLNPGFSYFLRFDPVAVFQAGEYWRIFTFLFVTPIQNAIFQFFYLYLLYVYGNALEETMGAFAFTLFYLIGALGTIIAAIFFGGDGGAFFVNTSIFLAFAALNPNFTIYLFFVIPVKMRWLALFTWGSLIYMFVKYPPSAKAAISVSMLNYFLFFGRTHYETVSRFVRRKRFEGRYKD